MAESVRLRQPALDLGAVVALPGDALRLRDADLGANVGKEIGQPLLAGAVDVRRPDVRRALVGADAVGDARHRLVERDAVETSLALRDLLDRRTGARGDAEHVRGAALLGGEVDVLRIRRPARRVRLEIPRRGQIDRCAAGGRPRDQIVRAAMRQLLLDDHAGAERPLRQQELPVGRIRERPPHVAVVREPLHVAGRRHGVDVGLLVGLFVLPPVVGRERDHAAVRMPRDVGGPHAEARDGLRLAAIDWRDRDLRGRACAWIGRRIVLAVGLEAHPVERAALESRCVALLEIGARDFGGRRARQLTRLRAPLAVGAERARWRGRCRYRRRIRRIHSDLEQCGVSTRPRLRRIAADEDGAVHLRVERILQHVVVGPSRRRDALPFMRDAPRRRRSVRRHHERLDRARVVLFNASRQRVGHPFAIRRDLRVADGFDLVVILDRQRALRLRDQRGGWKGEGDTGGDDVATSFMGTSRGTL